MPCAELEMSKRSRGKARVWEGTDLAPESLEDGMEETGARADGSGGTKRHRNGDAYVEEQARWGCVSVRWKRDLGYGVQSGRARWVDGE
jgi:hypothetical protein